MAVLLQPLWELGQHGQARQLAASVQQQLAQRHFCTAGRLLLRPLRANQEGLRRCFCKCDMYRWPVFNREMTYSTAARDTSKSNEALLCSHALSAAIRLLLQTRVVLEKCRQPRLLKLSHVRMQLSKILWARLTWPKRSNIFTSLFNCFQCICGGLLKPFHAAPKMRCCPNTGVHTPGVGRTIHLAAYPNHGLLHCKKLPISEFESHPPAARPLVGASASCQPPASSNLK